ncbi:MAG: PAS domain-containing protein [Sphingosinicella sp.]|uniref:PAS domain-containing protein n=1 Tax=Sphingosinicella sp. TaxID=1917971 RepID=UPI004037E0C5
MDSLRGFEDDAAPVAVEDEPAMERPPEIGIDERRMHVRAYNYWVSLLNGRPYPAIHDLDPQNIEDFGPHSVLIDFSQDEHDPQIAFLGRALRAECGLDQAIYAVGQVPSRSLLSRLTDHYLQIIANCAPIGFEAEFVGQRGHNTLYRGILMPLSSNGEAIDFIYGVINWKEIADSATVRELAEQVDRAIAAPPAAVWADGPNADAEVHDAEVAEDDATLSLWPDACLADRLVIARDSAGEAAAADQRSRAALYRALGHAHDFALAAASDPEAYAELLDDAGIKAQARAPMTPVVKLVFGATYDKTRLTEYAAALSWAAREGVPAGALAARSEAFEGGLKGIVAAERAARPPAPKADRWDEIRARLHSARPLAKVDIEVAGDGEFVLLVGRREADGIAIVAPVSDARLVDQAIRKSAA